MRSYFIWPASVLPKTLWPATDESVEARLSSMWPDAYPVLVSSARAGIVLTMSAFNLQRSDLVGVPPYASHCVLEAVSRVATLSPGFVAFNPKIRLLYHQWGYVQERNVEGVVIEDAVDSLCLPGSKLFPAGGNFEIWSLPKLLGCSCGGVIWCRNLGDAEKIRYERDKYSTGALLQWLLRIVGQFSQRIHLYWAGFEAGAGKLPGIAAGEILSALGRLQKIILDRESKLEIILSFKPAWLRLDSARLPCVLPVEVSVDTAERLANLGITSGYRHFDRVHPDGRRELIKMFPIPIHQDMPIDKLSKIVKLLESSK